MAEIYRGKHYVLYSQVALYDAEASDSYPEFETGEEAAIIAPKGIAVAAKNDQEAEIIVYQGQVQLNDVSVLVISGEIEVGSKGLIVGNEVTADTAEIVWQAGKTSVTVYTNTKDKDEVTKVVFALRKVDRKVE